MRLFIGISFESIRTQLMDIQNRLRIHVVKGNFTYEGNLHLTVEFLGELPPTCIPAIKAALRTLRNPLFELVFDHVGSFQHGGKDLVWIGTRPNPILQELQKDLSFALRQENFILENRPYTPHLTLAREVVFRDAESRSRSLGKILPISANVKAISLMNSERIDGRLIYTKLFSQTLPPS